MYREHFGDGKGLVEAAVGFTGGKTLRPSYRDVCEKSTGRKFVYVC
jgi:peptide-methionine (S)-S-oxide reductase